MFTILIGILGGVAVGFQTPMANAIGQRVGGVASSFIVHISGAVFSAILLLAQRDEILKNLPKLSWWMYGAGIFGIIIVVVINYTIPRIGAAAAITLVIIGQLTAGMLVDQFGLFGVEPRAVDSYRLLAVGFLLLGGYLMVRS